MNGTWQKVAWVSAGTTMGVALSLAFSVTANRDAKSAIPVDELRTFSEVFARIKNDYVEPVSDKKLIEQAIGGMVSSLDPHSTFLDESAFKDLRTTTTGKFGGIGIEIGTEDGFIKVVSPIDETPAARAGIRAGDLITKVDGESTRGLTTTKAVDLMRGNPGTKVRLEVFRKDDRSTQTFALLALSKAINAGNNTVCLLAPVNNLDQRGTIRPNGPQCDIGAYEYVDTTAPTISSKAAIPPVVKASDTRFNRMKPRFSSSS